jgi:hypothetical protein
MFEKIAVLTILYAALFRFDMPKLKKESRGAIILYLSFLLVSLYMSAKYIFELKLPDYYQIFEFALGKPAESIVKYLNVAP